MNIDLNPKRGELWYTDLGVLEVEDIKITTDYVTIVYGRLAGTNHQTILQFCNLKWRIGRQAYNPA